jgi:hypothetical protein
MSDIQYSSNVESIHRAREKRPSTIPNQVRLVVILDRSGSMKPHEQKVVESLRGFFAMLHKGLPVGSQCLLTLTQFGTTVETCALLQPLDSVPLNYQAVDQSTALWDAICYTLRLETSRHVPVLVLFATDGEENSSKEADLKQVQAMIRTREEWGNWRFYILNLQGRPSRSAAQLHVEVIDSTPEQMGEALANIARRMCRDVARLQPTVLYPLLKGGQ